MKLFFHCTLLLTTLLISCKKNREGAFTTDPLIRSIHSTNTDALPGSPEEITLDYNFRYDHRRLIAINNHHLFYDANNRLSWSRMEWIDSTGVPSAPLYNRRVRRFSYKWKNNAVDEIYLDSLYDQLLNSKGQTLSEQLQAGVLYSKFFRSDNNRIDSMVYLTPLDTRSSMFSARRFYYNGDNLSKTIDYLNMSIPPDELHLMFVTEALYNDISDPLFRIYKELTVLPYPLNFVPSMNYVSRYRLYDDPKGAPMPDWIDVIYELNTRGWPVKSRIEGPTSNLRTTTVYSYY